MTVNEYYVAKLEHEKQLTYKTIKFQDDFYTFHGDYVKPTAKISSGVIRSFVDMINSLE